MQLTVSLSYNPTPLSGKSISFYNGFHMRDMKGTPDDGYLWSTPNGGYKPATGYNPNTNVGLKW